MNSTAPVAKDWKWSVSHSVLSNLWPTDCSLPSSSVNGVLRARILEWVAIPFSSGSNPGLLHCRQILYRLSHQGKDYLVQVLNIEGVRNIALRQSTALLNEPGTWKMPQSNHQINFNAYPQTLRASVALRLPCWDLTRADSRKFLWSHLIYFWEYVGKMLIQLWENKPSGRDFTLCARRNSQQGPRWARTQNCKGGTHLAVSEFSSTGNKNTSFLLFPFTRFWGGREQTTESVLCTVSEDIEQTTYMFYSHFWVSQALCKVSPMWYINNSNTTMVCHRGHAN